MTRPRDSQRSKLYRAEHGVPSGANLGDLNDVRRFLDDFMSSRWFRSRWARSRPQLNDGRGRSSAAASPSGNELFLPRWARTPIVVLHELAHLLSPTTAAWHGPEFAGILLALVDRYDKETGKALRATFRTYRVRWNMKCVPAPRYEVPARTTKLAAKARPVASSSAAEAEEVLRRLIAQGRYGPVGSAPRKAALATARRLREVAQGE